MMNRWIYFLAILISGICPVHAYVSYRQSDETFEMKVNAYCQQSAVNDPEIRAATLIKPAISVIAQFKQDLLALIDTLETSKQYWEFQRDHRFSYATDIFNRFMTQESNNSINDKIKNLDLFIDKQLTNLGLLSVHLDLFNKDKKPDEQYAWFAQLCTIIIGAYPGSKLNPNMITHQTTAKMLFKATQCISHYRATITVQIKPYLMPNILQRNWIKIIGGIAATYYGSYFAYTRQDEIAEQVEKGSKNITGYAIIQYDLAKEALFGGEITTNNLQKNETILTADYEKILLELYKSLAYTEPNKNIKKEVDNFAPQYVEHISLDSLDPEKRKLFDPVTIAENAKALDLEYLDNVIFPVLSHMSSTEGRDLALVIKEVGQKMATADYTLYGNLVGTSKTITIKDVLATMGKGPVEKMAPLIDTVMKYPDVAILYGRLQKAQGKRVIWELKKQNHISLAIISSIPVALVLWVGGKGMYAIYKKMRGVMIYDSIRAALVDIAMLLNMYGDAQPSEMSPQDYGRLVYLVKRLEREEKSIPQALRTTFMHDVRFLQSSILTAAQKLTVIDLMYKRYPFLSTDQLHYQGRMA